MRKPITDNFQSLMMGKYLGEQYKTEACIPREKEKKLLYM
jgi:hypothetical protein